MKSKLAFDLAFAGYKNEQENIHFTLVKREVTEVVDNDNNSSIVAEQQQEEQNTAAASGKQQQRRRKVKKTMTQHYLQKSWHGRRNVMKRKRSFLRINLGRNK